MPLKAQPAVAAPLPYSWAGFYVGAQGGFGWGHAEDTDATPFDSGRFSVKGALIDTIPFTGVFAQHVRYTADIFRVGLNYKFDWAMLTPPR